MNHLTTETIEKFVKGEYQYGRLLEISAHLTVCSENCLVRLNQIDPNFLKQAERMENERTREIKFGNHFSDHDIEAYVTQEFDLKKRRSMSKHFTKCPVCAAKLKERDPDYLSNFIKDKLNREKSAEIVIKSEGSTYNFRFLVPAVTFSILLLVLIAIVFMLPNRQNIDQAKVEEFASPSPAHNSQNNTENKTNSANLESNQGTSNVPSNTNSGRNEQSNISKPSPNPVNIPTIRKQSNTSKTERQTIIVKDRSLNKNCENNPQLSISPRDEIITETEPTLTWKPLPNAAGYKVYVSDTENNLIETSSVSDAAKTFFKLTKKLELNKKYEWKVAVTLTDGKEVYSESALFSVGEKAKKLSPGKGKNKANEVRCLKN